MRQRRRGMRKWLVVLAVFLAIGIPAAYAASSANDKPAQAQNAADNAATKCKAERGSMGIEAFRAKYGTNHNLMNAFGKCVSSKVEGRGEEGRDEKDDNDDKAEDSAARNCKAERSGMGAEAFAKKYGTNHNLKNAFGKCVSSLSKAKNND